MRDLRTLDRWRINNPEIWDNNPPPEIAGAFMLVRSGVNFVVIATVGDDWDHVSVSLRRRVPSWAEMCWIKELFFEDEEEAFQLHPKKSEYVNIHPNCLHLWRPLGLRMPMPPRIFV